MSAESDDMVIVVGQQMNRFWFNGGWVYFGTGKLATCTFGLGLADPSDVYSSCDTSTSSSDTFYVSGGSGDDAIVVHQYGVFSCGSTYVGAWNGSFSFGLQAQGYTGADRIYGSPNADVLLSSRFLSLFGYVDDGSDDALCGYGGDDDLYGDTTDSTDFECMDGGDPSPGDYCDGGSASSPEVDRARNCSTVSEATTSSYTTYCPDFSGGDVYACPATIPHYQDLITSSFP